MTYPCPFCGTIASGETGCPACRRGPEPLALEVVRLDSVIADLTARLNATRLAAQRLEGELKQAWARRAAAASDVRVLVARSQAAPAPGPAREEPPAPPRRDASTRWIQNALFLLGGLLLAVAAIVFTAVAWAQFGVGGRAVVLAAFTLAALAVPLVAERRGLTATAETFAAVGLLLVLLDGYAAWYVNLLGVTRLSPWVYAALVCAVTAGVALALPRLTGPRFAALLIAQPVLPLVTAPLHLTDAGHAYTYAGVVLADLTVLVVTGGALRTVAGALAAAAVLPTGVLAVVALLEADSPARSGVAGAALLLTAVLPLLALEVLIRRAGLAASVAAPGLAASASAPGSAISASAPAPARMPGPAVSVRAMLLGARAFFAGLLVVEVAAVAVRIALLVAPGHHLLTGSLAVLAVAVVAATVRAVWLTGVVAGAVRAGAGLVLAPFAVAATAASVLDAGTTLRAARPALGAALSGAVPAADPRLPLVLATLAAGVAVTVPAGWRRLPVWFAVALALLSVPAAFHLPWWSAAVLDLAGAAAALGAAARYVATPAALGTAARNVAPRSAGRVALYGTQVVTAIALALHGVAVAFGAATVTAATLAGLGAIAAALAFHTRRGPRRLDLGGPGLLVSLLLLPAVAWATTAALASSPFSQSRVALAAALLPAGVHHLIGRRLGNLRPFGLAAALAPLAAAPLWAAGDSVAIYAAVALAGLATLPDGRPGRIAAVVPGVAFLVAVAEPLARVVAERTPHVPVSAPVAFLIVTAAAAVRFRRLLDVAAPFLALTVVLAVSAARVPWPYAQVAELSLGLAGLLAVALRPLGVDRLFPGAVSALLTAAGLAHTWPSRPAAVAALGAALVVAAVAGVAGRTAPARLTGWIAAVAAAVGVVHNAVAMAGVRPAYPLLALAAATFGVSWRLGARSAGSRAVGSRAVGSRAVEARAVEAAAHAIAVLALLLRPADPSIIGFVWGAVLGVRALRRDHRGAYLVAAAAAEVAAWCDLMAAHHVGTVEAYSLPAATAALLTGLVARRRQNLTSWVAYGPALAAAVLPSLAVILTGDGQHLRRLLLGLAALGVLLAGARARLQAPVIVGGGALGVLALHELALVWDLVPRWIPLAGAGLLLVLLAMTLERRRRDLDRLRSALTRMT